MRAELLLWVGLIGAAVMFFGCLVMNWYVYFGGAAFALVFGILGTRAMDRD